MNRDADRLTTYMSTKDAEAYTYARSNGSRFFSEIQTKRKNAIWKVCVRMRLSACGTRKHYVKTPRKKQSRRDGIWVKKEHRKTYLKHTYIKRSKNGCTRAVFNVTNDEKPLFSMLSRYSESAKISQPAQKLPK